MLRLLCAIVCVFVALSLLTPLPARTPRAFAASELSLDLAPADPEAGAPVLAGRIGNVDPDIAFVTVTVTLDDGSSLALDADGSNEWNFSFGTLPTEGWVGISLTETPIPVPTVTDDQSDYVYLPGYYYPYPLAETPWTNFTGYSFPAGYGWNTYPFGAYAWAQYLAENYSVPYYWTFPPLDVTPTYTYYGVAGQPATYMPATLPATSFGTVAQPQYLQLAQPTTYAYSPSPVVYSAATALTPPPTAALAARVLPNPVLVPRAAVSTATVSAPTFPVSAPTFPVSAPTFSGVTYQPAVTSYPYTYAASPFANNSTQPVASSSVLLPQSTILVPNASYAVVTNVPSAAYAVTTNQTYPQNGNPGVYVQTNTGLFYAVPAAAYTSSTWLQTQFGLPVYYNGYYLYLIRR